MFFGPDIERSVNLWGAVMIAYHQELDVEIWQ
jgi:hypothetical protein